MLTRRLLVLFTASIILTSCRASEDGRIKNLLEGRNKALSGGEARDYFSCLSLDYTDSHFPFSIASGRIREVLSSGQRPSVRFSAPDIYREGDRAVVREDFWIEGIISSKPRNYARGQHLRLKKDEDGEWKIMSGSQVYRLLAGQAEEEDRIEEVLDLREKALESKDIQMYLSVLSPSYNHRGKGVKELQQELTETFRVFDDIRFKTLERKISYYGGYALVEQDYRYEARLMGKPQVTSGKEQFELIPEDGEWKIVKGF